MKVAFNELEWINTLQYGILLAGGDDPPPPGDDPPPPLPDDPLPEDPPGDDPPVGDDPPPPPPQDPPPSAARTDWRDNRIAQLTARLRQYEPAGGKKPAAPAPDPTTPPRQLDQAELDRLVEQRASEHARVQEFNRRCNETAEAGRAAHADFDQRVGNLQRLHDPSNVQEAVQYNNFLLAALETGSASDLLHELGGDLNEAARIMQLSPVRMGVDLARMADKLQEGGNPSKAPPPPKTPAAAGGPGTSHTAISPTDPDRADRLSTAEWMKRREAQLAGATRH